MATPPQIRAHTFTTPGHPTCLNLTALPSPTTTSLKKQTYLLIRPHATALNPVDIQLQNLPLFHLPFWPFNVPKVTGCDFAGTVLAAGSDTGFEKGNEVMGVSLWQGWNGTLAEAILVDTAAGCVIRKPKEWSWEMGASVPLVWLTARTMVQNISAAVEGSVGKKVVVLGGSSATGMYCVHLARKRGWEVLSTCSGRNVEFVRGMGAGRVVDYTVENVREEVRRWGPDAIIDCVGGTECLDLAKRYVTIVGDKTTRSSMGGAMIYLWNPQMAVRWAMGKMGVWGVEYDCSNIQMVKEWLEEVKEVPQEKVVIDSAFEFERAKEAFERLNTGRARGKVVVKVGN